MAKTVTSAFTELLERLELTVDQVETAEARSKGATGVLQNRPLRPANYPDRSDGLVVRRSVQRLEELGYRVTIAAA